MTNSSRGAANPPVLLQRIVLFALFVVSFSSKRVSREREPKFTVERIKSFFNNYDYDKKQPNLKIDSNKKILQGLKSVFIYLHMIKFDLKEKWLENG